jgi:menaquinone-9 beta-reductase
MRTIKIIGGGVAGLALGIGLRQAGVPTELCEAGRYPRHRVCGEFISGAGQEVIELLDLAAPLKRAGAIEARNGAMFVGKARSPIRNFPRPALCISRYRLDEALATVYSELGGLLRTGSRLGEIQDRPGLIQATGRRPHVKENGWRWFGLKAHAMGLKLDADLEMHAVPNGYVGLCRLSQGVVNVCGLFRKGSTTSDSVQTRTGISTLRGTPGSTLHDKMAGARLDQSSFCSVAGLSWRREPRPQVCSIGDAFAMTPPVTGNGMSIAFETAGIALGPLVSYSRGALEWTDARYQIARRCEEALSRRLRWAGWLHRLMMSGFLQGAFGSVLLGSDRLWRMFFEATRSPGSVSFRDESAGGLRKV